MSHHPGGHDPSGRRPGGYRPGQGTSSTHQVSHNSWSHHGGNGNYHPTRYYPPVGGYHGPRWSSDCYRHFGWSSNPTGWYGRFGSNSWCIGIGYTSWSYQNWSSRYRCQLYYDQTTTGWYFYQPTLSCYVPYRYISYYSQPVGEEVESSEQVVDDSTPADDYPTTTPCTACGTTVVPVTPCENCPPVYGSGSPPVQPAPIETVAGNITPVSDDNPRDPDAEFNGPPLASATPR